MIAERKDITAFVPLKNVVRRALLDTWGDFAKDEARYQAWAIDCIKLLTRQTLKTGKRFALININKNLNSAILPCDFKEEIFVGLVDSCGEKIPLNINPNIVNNFLIEKEIPCDTPCPAKCNCYPKQLCNDLQTTQVINKITLNEIEYDQTVTKTLLPNGEYYQVTTTPVWNTVTDVVDYIDTKEYITTFDTETCGCIKPTARNECRLEACDWDLYCCYCTPCSKSNTEYGGYKIFYETGTIHFDGTMGCDKFYLEYLGSLPKSGNEYLVPEVAYETLIEMTKWYSVRNKKGVPQWERESFRNNFIIARTDMVKVMGRMSLTDIFHAASLVPQFNFNYNVCNSRGSYVPCVTNTVQSGSTVITTTTTVIPSGSCNPSIYTTNGSLMEGGTKYNNPRLIGVPFRVFANSFNRMLTTSEYIVLPTGGFDLSPLGTVYGLADEFDIYPKWCDANIADIPITPSPATICCSGKIVIKVDGLPNSPVNNTFTYSALVLIGAVVEDILVNKVAETLVDGDFTFDTVTGVMTRVNPWITGDTCIINYSK